MELVAHFFFGRQDTSTTWRQKHQKKAAGMQSDEVTKSLLEKNVDLGNGDATTVEVEHATTVEVELRTLINIGYDITGFLKCILFMCLIIVVVQLLLVFVQIKK